MGHQYCPQKTKLMKNTLGLVAFNRFVGSWVTNSIGKTLIHLYIYTIMNSEKCMAFKRTCGST